MSKLQDVIKAKAFLEMLTLSIDPATGDVVKDSILSRRENIETLKYIMTLLDELIANNGEVVALEKPIEFTVEKINKNKVVVSDAPLQIGGFATRINKQADALGMKRIGPSQISKWLISRGYLQENIITVTKEVKEVGLTETSSQIGLVGQEKVDKKTGEIKTGVLLTRVAQEYILENLEKIVNGDDSITIATSTV